jgi:ribonuclease Z
MYPFTAWSGRWQPLRLYGPSGASPELGIKHMAHHMREMLKWHEDNFNAIPIGDGYEMDVTEIDWKDENGVCYDHEGVVVRHWPRSHVKDGASAFRLDWEEYDLSFVWTGDGRPDVLSAKYGKDVDLFVSEGQMDTPMLQALKFGTPAELVEFTIDSWHTMYYAAGYLFEQVQPRMAMICHYESGGPAFEAEAVAQVRSNWKGLFSFAGPDVQVVNVTKDAIWMREAAMPEGVAISPMDPRWMLPKGAPLPEAFPLPTPKIPRTEQQEQFLRDNEIDPKLYYPDDAYRVPFQTWPDDGIELNPRDMLRARGIKVNDDGTIPDEQD